MKILFVHLLPNRTDSHKRHIADIVKLIKEVNYLPSLV